MGACWTTPAQLSVDVPLRRHSGECNVIVFAGQKKKKILLLPLDDHMHLAEPEFYTKQALWAVQAKLSQTHEICSGRCVFL